MRHLSSFLSQIFFLIPACFLLTETCTAQTTQEDLAFLKGAWTGTISDARGAKELTLVITAVSYKNDRGSAQGYSLVNGKNQTKFTGIVRPEGAKGNEGQGTNLELKEIENYSTSGTFTLVSFAERGNLLRLMGEWKPFKGKGVKNIKVSKAI